MLIKMKSCRVMGNLFFGTFIVLQAAFAAPIVPARIVDGIDEAVVVCNKIISNNEKIDCLKAIGSASYFSPAALNVCSNFNSDSGKKTCLSSIINKDIRDTEALGCEKKLYENDRKSCLVGVQRTYSNPTARDLPKSGDGINQAAEACNALPYDSDKRACLKGIGAATYFSVSSVKICSSFFYDKDKETCLATITNKDIRDSEASACNSLVYESDKKACLFNIQRKMTPFREDKKIIKKADNIKNASDFCLGLPTDKDKHDCLTVLDNAYYFSSDALDLCSKFNFSSDAKACIGIIVNKDIRPFEAKICGAQVYDTDKKDCLKSIERKAPNSTKRTLIPVDGTAQATEFCADFAYDSDKAACTKIVTAASYFSIPSLEICSSFTYDSDKISCLSMIADKEIRQSEAMSCQILTFESDKKACLGKFQKTIEKSF